MAWRIMGLLALLLAAPELQAQDHALRVTPSVSAGREVPRRVRTLELADGSSLYVTPQGIAQALPRRVRFGVEHLQALCDAMQPGDRLLVSRLAGMDIALSTEEGEPMAGNLAHWLEDFQRLLEKGGGVLRYAFLPPETQGGLRLPCSTIPGGGLAAAARY